MSAEEWYTQFLPGSVSPEVVKRALAIGVKWNKYEHNFTGMLMLIGDCTKVRHKIMQQDFHEMTAKKGLNIFNDDQDAEFKELFQKDGGVIVHPYDGMVMAVTCKLYPGPDCVYQHRGHGTKHNSALETTWDVSSVAVVRSDSGGVTMYSTLMTQKGTCAQIEDHRGL